MKLILLSVVILPTLNNHSDETVKLILLSVVILPTLNNHSDETQHCFEYTTVYVAKNPFFEKEKKSCNYVYLLLMRGDRPPRLMLSLNLSDCLCARLRLPRLPGFLKRFIGRPVTQFENQDQATFRDYLHITKWVIG